MYRALVSFSGLVSAVAGQVIDIPDTWIAKDLLGVGYIEEITSEETKEGSPKETPKPKTKRKTKTPKGA